jgi:hypothetical protein
VTVGLTDCEGAPKMAYWLALWGALGTFAELWVWLAMVGMARFTGCGLRMGAADFAGERRTHNDAACVYEPGAGSDTGVDEEA